MRRGAVVRIALVGVAVGVVTSLFAVFIPWLPTSASEEMDGIAFTFWFATVICIGIFALVMAVILYSVVAFRVRPDDDTDGPPIHGHTGLEIVWTVIPAVLVTAISVVSAIVLAKNDDAGPNPLKVAVSAQQFAWSFKYPGADGPLSGKLVLPIHQSTVLSLTAADVIHSFWVPEFGQKQDAVPGITTRLVITPKRLGTFPVICTELCGLGHSTMRSEAIVLSRADYDKWLADQRSGAATQGSGGAGVFAAQGCGSCHALAAAGSTGQVGPSLDTLDAAAKKAGKPLEAYVRESIVQPDAYLAPGYQGGVMPKNYADLPQDQLDQLVRYLASGGKGSE